MSLINDALKKAQKQREDSGATPPGAVAPPPVASNAPAPSPSPVGKNNVALIVAGAAVIVSLSVAATVYLLRNDTRSERRPDVANTTPQPPPSPPSSVSPNASPSGVVSPTSPLPGETNRVGSETKRSSPMATAAPAPSSVVPPPSTVSRVEPPMGTPPGATPAQNAPAAGQTAPPLSTAAAVSATTDGSALKSTYRIQGLVDKFRISGIRLADTDSKVLLNDHLFRVNDLVESSLGLRLTAIASHVLTFTDADGNVYLKHF